MNTAYFYLVWAMVLISTLGSLFFSEIMQLPPCVLCWYQRIAMYPLAILLPVAILTEDTLKFRKYALTLSVSGLVIAIYHNLLYYGFISESLVPCKAGVSCTSRQLEWLGFITIPLLSLTGFSLITLLLIIHQKRSPKS